MPADIRAATDADLEAIRAIYAHEVEHGTATYEVVAPDAGEMARRRRALVDAGYPFLVASADGRVAGYAYGSAYRTREGYRWTVEDSIYVDAAYRGRGIGASLLRELIARCEAGGWRQMVAVIGDGSNLASIRLHEAQGFRIAARFPGLGRKFGRWLENVQMQRALGEGDRSDPAALHCPGPGDSLR